MYNGKNKTKQRISIGVMVVWCLFVVTFLAVWLPTLLGLGHTWYASDDFSHGFLILPLVGYVIWQLKDDLAKLSVQGTWIGLPVVVVSLMAFLFGKVSSMTTLTSLSLIIFIWGGVLYLYGCSIFRKLLFPLFFLLFMIPVPSQVYAALTMPLQLIVTRITVAAAALTGIPVYREGNVIHLPDMTFQVIQACSGLRSIMTMLTLGAIIAYFFLKSPISRTVLFISAIPVSIAINIFRVFSMVVGYHFFKLNLMEGTPHTMLGLAVFILALAIFMLIQKGLARCEK